MATWTPPPDPPQGGDMPVGSAKQVPNGNGVFGGHLFGTVDYTGPKSYDPNGDDVDPRIFGFPGIILTPLGGVSTLDIQMGQYRVEWRAVGTGNTKWKLIWRQLVAGGNDPSGDYIAAHYDDVAAGTDLSGYTVRLAAFGF